MLGVMVIDGMDVPEDGPARDAVADLLVAVASGDQAAFAELYDTMSSRVLGLILRVLVNRSQSEEVLQEVFLEIWQSASRFAPNKGQGRTWIMTMAHRRAVDRVRSSQSSTDRDVKAGLRDIGVAHDSVAEQVELSIEGERVASALAGLPEAQREAIVLHYLQDRSLAEIAEQIGRSPAAVAGLIQRGIKQLRVRLRAGDEP